MSVDLDQSKSVPFRDDSSTEASFTSASFLSHLKSPTPADLARKRKVRTNQSLVRTNFHR